MGCIAECQRQPGDQDKCMVSRTNLVCPPCPPVSTRVAMRDKGMHRFPLLSSSFSELLGTSLAELHRCLPTSPTHKSVALRYCTPRHVSMSEPWDQLSFEQLLNDDSLMFGADDLGAHDPPVTQDVVQDDQSQFWTDLANGDTLPR